MRRRRRGAPDSREAIGGMWEEVGRLQFAFLVRHGLKPTHRLLDIGCGSLRGGVHFVGYLEDGNYYGVDRERWLLDAGRDVELYRRGLADRTVHLLAREDFDVSSFGVRFDYVLAQSLFTHLPWNSILRCLVNVREVLEPDGRFYATYFEDPDGSHHASALRHSPGDVETQPDADPFHYEFDVFAELAKRVRLRVERIGEWGHPRAQSMMVFRTG